MNKTLLYRIAAVALIFTAAAYFLGYIGYLPPSHDAQEIRKMTSDYCIEFGGDPNKCNFHRSVTPVELIYLLFAAIVTWHLGGLVNRRQRRVASSLAVALQLTFCLDYFFHLINSNWVTKITSCFVLVTLIWANWPIWRSPEPDTL